MCADLCQDLVSCRLQTDNGCSKLGTDVSFGFEPLPLRIKLTNHIEGRTIQVIDAARVLLECINFDFHLREVGLLLLDSTLLCLADPPQCL